MELTGVEINFGLMSLKNTTKALRLTAGETGTNWRSVGTVLRNLQWNSMVAGWVPPRSTEVVIVMTNWWKWQKRCMQTGCDLVAIWLDMVLEMVLECSKFLCQAFFCKQVASTCVNWLQEWTWWLQREDFFCYQLYVFWSAHGVSFLDLVVSED